MADFVAVIRRAVDGLASDTPELRAKVYDKARAAVQRQLENMKPRPPEDLLLRQLEKLEAAIAEVESEHSEALAAAPAAPEVEAADAVPDRDDAPVVAEAVPEAEPVDSVPAPEDQQPAPAEPAGGETDAAQDEPVSHVVAPDEVPPASATVAEEHWPADPVPASDERQDHRETEYETDVADAPKWSDPHPLDVQQDDVAAPEDGEALDSQPPVAEPLPEVPAFVTAWSEVEPRPLERDEPASAQPEPWEWEVPAGEEDTGPLVDPGWDAAPEVAGHASPAPAPDHAVPMPLAADPFTAVPGTDDAPDAARDAPRAEDGSSHRAAEAEAERDPWSDLEDLIGYNRDGTPDGDGSSAGGGDDEMAAPVRPFRVKPVRRRNYAGIVFAVLGLALAGGGGYALYLNRDSVGDVVDGLIQSSLSTVEVPQQEASTPAPVPAGPEQGSAAPMAAGIGEVADDGDGGRADGSKFTQRLLPDGGEVDEGPGATSTLENTAEGQSVAQLNAPLAVAGPAETASPPSVAEGAPGGDNNGAAPAPALTGEKLFLYEEHPGQTTPVALEGAVTWSLQREAGEGGRMEPVIQGRINVPGRGLTALMSLKRNSDSSLPASHLIELVFALPANFDGGAIENVQRVALKQTEQDRGNALIAVPAKITDDFHMIALNDFPDARASNLELLRSRDWIDIPLTYRNGRRALLTLQKGTQGTRAFNEAIREWAALTPTPAAGQ